MHSSLLRQIDAVARAGSIRGAAEALNVSASSINRRLIQLETDLGTPLFHRASTGMRLTAAGEVVLAHVRQTLRDAERMRARLQEMQGLRGARVRLSAVHGLAEGVLARVLTDVRARHPAVSVIMRARSGADVEGDLATGEADLGLAYTLRGDAPWPAPASAFPARLGAIVAVGDPLAGRKDLRLSELAGRALAIADESLVVHALVAEAFDRSGLRLAPAYVTNSTGLLKYLARSGRAVTLLSRFDVDEDLRAGLVRYIPVLGPELRSHELRLGHRRGATLQPAASMVEEAIRSALAEVAA